MKKLLLSILVMASFNLYAQNVSQKDADIAVKRVMSYIYGKYLVEHEEKDKYQLNKKNVWFLGKDEPDICDIFAVEAMLYGVAGGKGAEKSLFLTSTSQVCPINIDELELYEGGNNNWEIEKQTKQPPNPEFLITTLEYDDMNDALCCPSMKYQQKFRFNNKTLKFEPIGKKQFIGKKQY